LREGAENRLVEEDGVSEIAPCELAEEQHVLHEERLIEAEARSQGGNIGWRRIWPQHHAGWSPGATRTIRNTIVTTTNITVSMPRKRCRM
jgi:hypothetical protein